MGFSLLSGNTPKYPAIPKDKAKDYNGNIVIIGAGVAGLFAARALQHMGVKNYIVLEATDRIGGRLKQTDNLHNDVPLDMGAEWIHYTNEQVVKDMLVFDEEGRKQALAAMEGLEPTEFIKYQPNFFFRKKERKLISHLYQETKWKRSTWWQWLDKYIYRHVEDKVNLNCPVKKIVYDTLNANESEGAIESENQSEQVKVILESGEIYMADKVICTIPLAVLKKEVENGMFDPPLPQNKIQTIDAVDMPPGFRILFEMKDKFYPDATVDNGICGQIMDGDEVCAIYDPLYGKDLPSDGQNVLAFVAIGNKYADLGELNDEELASAALAKIDKYFDGKGTKNHIKHEVQNWTQEPFILGSYSFPCDPKHNKALGETVGGKLLFAGEHTSIKYHSLVNGAAMEGRRAAVKALANHLKK